MLNFLKKLATPFAKIKSLLGQKIRSVFSKGDSEESYEELERLLYEADLGAPLAASIVSEVRVWKRKHTSATPDELLGFVKSQIRALFGDSPKQTMHSPHVILVVGVNGSGKTTSIAKLAKHYRNAGKTVVIGAGDTFRAAAVEQLERWASQIGADLVKGQSKGDPSAVAFDAVSAAIARKSDVLLIDTAGRLQNKTDLMHELAKVRRVIQKLLPDAPHETLLVLDATIGQNGVDQARVFNEFVPLTGIVLSKLDGSAKGGLAAAVQKELGIPVMWTGVGEGAEDLAVFDPAEYVEALLS